jgi:hypothetical protein
VLAALDAAVARVASGTVDIGAYELGNTGSGTGTGTIPPTGTASTLAPSEDTHVRAGTYATTTFGTASELEIQSSSDLDQTRDAYLRFDLRALSSVSSAKFRLYARLSASGAVGVTLFPAPGAWSEATLVWNLRPGYTSGNPLGTFALASTTASWFEADVTSYVRSEHQAGRRLVSFALHSLAPSTPRAIASSREASGNRPALVVTP